MAFAPRLSLIVCTQPRSGSYLLGDLLGLATEVPPLEEWLIPTFQIPEASRFGLPEDFDRVDYVKELVRRKTNAAGIFSIKIMGWNFAEFIANMRSKAVFSGATTREIFETLFPNPRFLYLRRSDHLSQAVSYAKAIQTQHWRAEHETRRKAGTVGYSTLFIRDQFVGIQRSEEGWQTFFKESAIRPFELRYEHFLKAPLQALAEICAWLGILPPSNLSAARKRLNEGRQSSVINAEWKQRFAQENAYLSARKDPAVPFEPNSCELTLEATALTTEAFQSTQLNVTVRNRSRQTWTGGSEAYDRDEGWMVVTGHIAPEEGKTDYRPYLFQEVPFPLLHGEDKSFPLFVPARSKSGLYRLPLSIQQFQDGKWQRISQPVELTLEITKTAALKEAENVFSTLQELPANQCHVPGLGIFSHRNFPWIHHRQHGWMFVDVNGSSANEIWIHDEVLKWLSFDPDRPDELFDYQRKEIIRFVDCRKGHRHFYNLTTCKPETYPLQKIPEHRPDTVDTIS